MGMPAWYAENGQYVTTKFFGMKINRYLHDHGISPATLAKVAAKNYRNGSLNPKAFRRSPMSEEDILASPMLNYPLTASCSALPTRALPRSCCAGPTSRTATPTLRSSSGPPRSARASTAPTRSTPRGPGRRGRVADGLRVEGGVRGRPASVPKTSTSSSCRTPTLAPRSSTWPRTASVPTATRRGSSPTAPPRSAARCR